MILIALLGVLLLGISVVYFITPANNLPSFFPGHEAGLMKTHMKHGIGSLILGLGCFVLVWFQTGKKSSEQK
jgi:amino acid permease